MTNQNSNSVNQQRRFSQEQYDMLKRCSDKKDTTEWNEWRKTNPKDDILLERADFRGFWLAGTNFMKGTVHNNRTGEDIAYCGQVHLEKANFEEATLEGTNFFRAHLEKCRFQHVRARDACFVDAHLENANLSVAHLEECNFHGAILHNAKIISSWLILADFTLACMQGCSIRAAVVGGATKFWKPEVNRFTDLSGTSLDTVRIDTGTKQLLEYNIRRMNWEEWYKDHRLLKWLVRPFWLMSDYGLSTVRIIFTFFGLAVVFAGIYYLCALANPPGIVHGLIEGKEGLVPAWLLPFRSIYFSIVTMTTLGFGDMHANCQSFWGHLLLIFQVLFGYVLLGALVTRFAVLFTAGGPAGEFKSEKKKG